MEENNMIEEWKVYKDTRIDTWGRRNRGFLWEISNLGRVRRDGIIYNCKLTKSGYCRCAVGLIHRIVAELYIGEIPKGYVIDHIDGNKLNNNVNNLRICTQKENVLNEISYNRLVNGIRKSWNNGRIHPLLGKESYNRNTHREYQADGTFKMVKNVA